MSVHYHKITFNPQWFSVISNAPTNNQFGYYYSPHSTLKIRQYSDYVEDSNYEAVADIPNYAYYSNLSNGFIWRDIYEYGFIDANGLGVNYPFTNGKHYPYKNTIFRIIPEGSNTQNINEIAEPTIDGCE